MKTNKNSWIKITLLLSAILAVKSIYYFNSFNPLKNIALKTEHLLHQEKMSSVDSETQKKQLQGNTLKEKDTHPLSDWKTLQQLTITAWEAKNENERENAISELTKALNWEENPIRIAAIEQSKTLIFLWIDSMSRHHTKLDDYLKPTEMKLILAFQKANSKEVEDLKNHLPSTSEFQKLISEAQKYGTKN